MRLCPDGASPSKLRRHGHRLPSHKKTWALSLGAIRYPLMNHSDGACFKASSRLALAEWDRRNDGVVDAVARSADLA